MKISVELTESDLRALAYQKLKGTVPDHVLESFGSNDFEVKMTYRENETWRCPRYLRLSFSREVDV